MRWLLDLILSLGPSCGDPNCTICGPSIARAEKRRQKAAKQSWRCAIGNHAWGTQRQGGVRVYGCKRPGCPTNPRRELLSKGTE